MEMDRSGAGVVGADTPFGHTAFGLPPLGLLPGLLERGGVLRGDVRRGEVPRGGVEGGVRHGERGGVRGGVSLGDCGPAPRTSVNGRPDESSEYEKPRESRCPMLLWCTLSAAAESPHGRTHRCARRLRCTTRAR
jgi:hypothetical protein